MLDSRVIAICKEFDVEIVGKSRYPEPGQTRAPETMSRIVRRYGEAHLRMVMTTLRETANNHALLDEVGLWAASDMVRACSDIIDSQTSEWLAFWDVMPVGPLQATALRLSGVVPVRYALDGMLFERISGRFGDKFNEPDFFDDRRTA